MRKKLQTRRETLPTREYRPPIDPIEAGLYVGGISHWTMRRLARERLIPHLRLGSRLMFRPDDLDAYIASGLREKKSA